MREHEIGPNEDASEDFATIREAIDWLAGARGDAAFLISPETGRILTFAGLKRQARAISARLLAAGLRRGDKVAFLMDNGLFTAQLFLGTMYAGLVTVPLNVRAGVAQLASTLDHCDAKMVFIEDQYKAVAEEALAGASNAPEVVFADIDSLADERATAFEDAGLAAPTGGDPALLMYSSGSVGRPKAAIHSHRNVLSHGRNSILSHRLTRADRSLLVLPMYHINAECVTLIPTLLSGGSVVAPRHFSVSAFWDLLEEYRCTWSAVVPTIIAQLLDWNDPRRERAASPRSTESGSCVRRRRRCRLQCTANFSTSLNCCSFRRWDRRRRATYSRIRSRLAKTRSDRQVLLGVSRPGLSTVTEPMSRRESPAKYSFAAQP